MVRNSPVGHVFVKNLLIEETGKFKQIVCTIRDRKLIVRPRLDVVRDNVHELNVSIQRLQDHDFIIRRCLNSGDISIISKHGQDYYPVCERDIDSIVYKLGLRKLQNIKRKIPKCEHVWFVSNAIEGIIPVPSYVAPNSSILSAKRAADFQKMMISLGAKHGTPLNKAIKAVNMYTYRMFPWRWMQCKNMPSELCLNPHESTDLIFLVYKNGNVRWIGHKDRPLIIAVDEDVEKAVYVNCSGDQSKIGAALYQRKE